MILIADSGSSKTTWCCINNDNSTVFCNTGGINPFYLNSDEICRLLVAEFTIDTSNISSIFFYGAGCIPEKKQVVYDALSTFFKISNICIESDLLAAARSLCQSNEGLACILGTGSNSCYYNGKEIGRNIAPLGYILGDEGSGAVLGKQLIADILKNQISKDVQNDFFAHYSLTVSNILDSVYRQPFANRYLAQFTKFIAKHIDKPEIELLVNNCFDEFIKRNIMQYDKYLHLPLNFAGSVAYFFRANLEKTISKYKLKIGTISQTPIEGLITYHLELYQK